jgi:hypothetical protein
MLYLFYLLLGLATFAALFALTVAVDRLDAQR